MTHQKLTFTDLSKMANKALELQEIAVLAFDNDMSCKYSLIWNRLAQAMLSNIKAGRK